MMNYWERRQQELNRAMEKDEEKLKKRLSDFYDAEFKRLTREIAAYYQQYGVDKVIEYRQLLQSLPAADIKLLMERMDDFAVKYPQYANLIPVRESIYKLDRLQGLQYSILMTEEEIAGYTNVQLREHLLKLSRQSLNISMETLGFGKNFYSVNDDIVKQFVDVSWSNGENFSSRIWGNTQKLAQYLNTDIAQGFARGDSYDKLTRNLQQRFDRVNRRDAYRLIYTEGTYVMAEATMQPFLEDFQQYRLSTVGDGKVCEICKQVARSVFNISDRKPGVNFPPLHPWCRCTFTIEVDDWDAWMEDYEKRHGNGKANTIKNRLNGSDNGDIIKLPRYDEAVIPKAKFTQYALNPEKDPNKARAFKSALGYDLDNADDLIEQINAKLPDYEAVEKGDRGWGKRYEVIMDIEGPNGKTAKVLTAWIDDKNTGEMRLTSVYVDKE